MTPHFWTRRILLLSVAVVTLAAVAAAFSIGLAYPEPVSSAALGPNWQCTRLAFVVTSCKRSVRNIPPQASARMRSMERDPKHRDPLKLPCYLKKMFI